MAGGLAISVPVCWPPFEMLVAFPVTETGDDFFVARRTDAKDRSIAELRYAFLPNGCSTRASTRMLLRQECTGRSKSQAARARGSTERPLAPPGGVC